MALMLDHERAKSAYEEVKNFLTSKVELPEGIDLAPLDVTKFEGKVECDKSFLRCFGPLTENDRKYLKKVAEDSDKWGQPVETLKKQVKEKDFERFKTWARKFPFMIKSCGLMQSIAFCHEKCEDLYWITARWLKKRMSFFQGVRDEDVTEAVSKLSMDMYRYATKEVIDYMIWVKNATNIYMPD